MTLLESLEIKKNYLTHEPLHSLVFDGYVEYVKTGKYPYLENMTDFLLAKYPEAASKRDALKTQVYFAADRYRKQQEQLFHDKMIADGWKPIQIGDAKTALQNGKKIRLYRRSESILGSSTKDCICRPVVNGDNEYLLPPKHRSTGWSLSQLCYSLESTQFIQFV